MGKADKHDKTAVEEKVEAEEQAVTEAKAEEQAVAETEAAEQAEAERERERERERSRPAKPKYSVWQNSAYVLHGAWARDKNVIYIMLAQIVLTPVIPAVAMFLPKTVVAHILGGQSISVLAATVLGFTAATVLLQTTKSYLEKIENVRRVGLRMWVCRDIFHKATTTDFANLENKSYTDAKQKAHDVTVSNNTSTEQIYYTFVNLGVNVLGFALYTALLVNVNPLVLAIAAATSAAGYAARRRANKWQHDHDDENASYNKRIQYISHVGEEPALAKDIRMFKMIDWLRDVYSSYLKMSFNWQRRAGGRQYAADAVDCAAAFLREGAAYAYLIWLVLYGGLPVDQFVLLFAAIGGFSGWVTGVLNEYSTLGRRSLDYCRLREYLEYPESFLREGGREIASEPGAQYTLELRGVSFRYPGADGYTLQGIDLTIRAGDKLAVVGLNGAGKTTLVKLLCGFYDPADGAILLNGTDIRVYNREMYYRLFTAVFQEFNILPVTIAENIAQLPTGEFDRSRVERCMELAGFAMKAASLPDGADTLLRKEIYDEAVDLSGGETQRLMLARALYRDAPILILDEPTAALDPIAESRLYDRYNELSEGRTSIYISHRLASTRFCDRIIFIDGKSIAETGTHDELMSKGAKYAELFEIQSRYYREDAEDAAGTAGTTGAGL
ncbi:MAG: ABC transporter ATP-binding protein/permease [Oscillospiraceae bacterium]|nr:ABC transporter ATP-binding protein/permease [Oscillospiraceae bacterium]